MSKPNLPHSHSYSLGKKSNQKRNNNMSGEKIEVSLDKTIDNTYKSNLVPIHTC